MRKPLLITVAVIAAVFIGSMLLFVFRAREQDRLLAKGALETQWQWRRNVPKITLQRCLKLDDETHAEKIELQKSNDRINRPSETELLRRAVEEQTRQQRRAQWEAECQREVDAIDQTFR